MRHGPGATGTHAGCLSIVRRGAHPAIQRLAAAAGLHRYRRGQILFVEGDSGDSLLLIVDGTLKAYSTSAEGEELSLAVVGPGETLGELTLADGGSRSASVAAFEPMHRCCDSAASRG